MSFQRFIIVPVSLLALLPCVAGCGSDTPASPSSSATTTTSIAPATLTEIYNGTLSIGGSRFYSFTVVQNGTVNVTLGVLDGPDVAPDATVSLSLGRPAGAGCTPSATVNVSTQTAAPQITGTYAPGVYCVSIADTSSSLPSAASFSIAIEHS